MFYLVLLAFYFFNRYLCKFDDKTELEVLNSHYGWVNSYPVIKQKLNY